MNQTTKKIIFSMVIIILVQEIIAKKLQLNQKEKINPFDLISAVNEFCAGKSTNFCSKEHLGLVHRIERQRNDEKKQQQMKRMKGRLIKHITKIIVG